MAGCEDCTLLLFMFAVSVPGHVSRNLSAARKTAGTVPVRALSFAPCTRPIRPDGACRHRPLLCVSGRNHGDYFMQSLDKARHFCYTEFI